MHTLACYNNREKRVQEYTTLLPVMMTSANFSVQVHFFLPVLVKCRHTLVYSRGTLFPSCINEKREHSECQRVHSREKSVGRGTLFKGSIAYRILHRILLGGMMCQCYDQTPSLGGLGLKICILDCILALHYTSVSIWGRGS